MGPILRSRLLLLVGLLLKLQFETIVIVGMHVFDTDIDQNRIAVIPLFLNNSFI